MSRPKSRTLRRAAVAGGVLAGLAVPSAAMAADSTAVVLTTDNRISTFETNRPAEATAPVAVTGLTAGEKLAGIDFRPQNGFLYGIGYKFDATTPADSTIQLYAISVRTGVASPIGGTTKVSGKGAGAPTATTQFGFDFNPTVDRIRVVSDSGFNARLNPNNGALVDYTNAVAGTPEIPGTGTTPTVPAVPAVPAVAGPDLAITPSTVKVDGAAYTNNQQNATVTTLYTLSGADDKLYLQTPPNDGVQTAGKAVTVNGAAVNFDSVGGFDITPGVNVTAANGAPPTGSGGFVATNVGGAATLSAVDLNTGAASPVGLIGDGKTPIQGLAIQQEATVGGLPAVALLNDNKLRRFNSADPLAGTEVSIASAAATPTDRNGLTAGETAVAVDWRAQTGQLLLLGVDAAKDTGTLYRLDPQTGVATVIGTRSSVAFVERTVTAPATTPAAVNLPASGYDIDVNPTVDRVRVVTTSGLNFRLNPTVADTASVAVDGSPDVPTATPPVVGASGTNTDGAQTPTTATVGGTAYTNAFGQSLTGGFTTQYGLSPEADQLQIQNPPNDGTQTLGKKVTVGGATLDFTGVRGFDVPPAVRVGASNTVATGSGVAILSTAARPDGSIYSIDLSTGAATLRGSLPTTAVATSMALGDGPPPAATRPPVIVPPVVVPPVVQPPVVQPPVVTPKPPTTPKAGFSSSTKLTVKLRATRISRNGPAKVTFRNTNKFAVKVRIQATTPKSGKRKAIKYATKTYTVKAGASRTVNVSLPSAARKVLSSTRKLTIKTTLRVTAPDGKNRTVRKTLTARRK